MPRVTPFDDLRRRFAAGKFGVGVFLVSLGMLFAASIVGFIVIRVQTRFAWPTDLPPLPRVLWLSTAVLLVSSGTMQLALLAVRQGHANVLRIMMILTTALGFTFLALQIICWRQWLEPVTARWNESNEFRYALASFYVLTGLHALHVIGGLIPMLIVTGNALRDRYRPDHHPGVQYCAMYWHFLDVVWLVLYAALLLGV